MNLNKRPAISEQWIAAAQPTLDGFLNCTIELVDLHLGEVPATYDWRTNTGSNSTTEVLFSGDAQMQVYRFTLTMDAPAGSVDQVRNARFTVSAEEIGDIDVRKNMIIRVTSCPNNTTLERYQYVVNSGLNSGWALRRTIETEVDMARVV